MSSIYENKKNAELLDGGTTVPSKVKVTTVPLAQKSEERDVAVTPQEHQFALDAEISANLLNKELGAYQERILHIQRKCQYADAGV